MHHIAPCLSFALSALRVVVIVCIGVVMRLALTPASSTQAVRSHHTEFAYAGAPIHPAVIQSLMRPMQSLEPYCMAVDVAAFGDTDMYELTYSRGRCGAYRLDEYGVHTGEFVGYTHIGILPNGAHVLDVYESGGGSAAFRSLVLVCLDDVAQRSLLDDRRRGLIMSSVDQIALGDRNDARVSVDGDGVLIQGTLEGDLAALGAGKDRVVLKLR